MKINFHGGGGTKQKTFRGGSMDIYGKVPVLLTGNICFN